MTRSAARKGVRFKSAPLRWVWCGCAELGAVRGLKRKTDIKSPRTATTNCSNVTRYMGDFRVFDRKRPEQSASPGAPPHRNLKRQLLLSLDVYCKSRYRYCDLQ